MNRQCKIPPPGDGAIPRVAWASDDTHSGLQKTLQPAQIKRRLKFLNPLKWFNWRIENETMNTVKSSYN